MGNRLTTGATACWLTASAGLVGVIMLQLSSDISLTTAVTAAPSEAPAEEGDEASAPIVGHLTVDVLDDIIDRPLFSLSRRPFATPVEEGAAEEAPRVAKPLSVKLAGTMLAGPSRLALFTHPSKGLLRLREGQDVDGWLVIDVRDDEVRLKQGNELKLLRLRKGVAPKAKPSVAGGAKQASTAKNQPPVGTLDGDQAAAEPAVKRH